jgi:hypothetical protein
MDARRFRTEPWNGEYENPEGLSDRRIAVFGEAISFLVTFSLGQQGKRHSAAAADENCAVPKELKAHGCRVMPTQR